MTGNGGSRDRPPRMQKGKSSRLRVAAREKRKDSKGVAEHLIWGIHPVLDLLARQPALIHKIVFLKEPKAGKLLEIAESAARAN